MQRFFVASLFAVCAAGTYWNGVTQIGLGLHQWFGVASVAVSLGAFVYLSLIDDLLIQARQDRLALANGPRREG